MITACLNIRKLHGNDEIIWIYVIFEEIRDNVAQKYFLDKQWDVLLNIDKAA